MRLSVVVITVAAALVLAVALAGAQEPAKEYLAGYDVLRTGVSPYDFKFPPVLSWQFTTDEKNADEPVASVAVGPDLVYAPVGSNLYGLDRQTGQQKWKLSLGGKCFCTPVVAGDVVYVGTESKQLVAVSAKAGQRLWAFPTTAAVRGEPLLFEYVLYSAPMTAVSSPSTSRAASFAGTSRPAARSVAGRPTTAMPCTAPPTTATCMR